MTKMIKVVNQQGIPFNVVLIGSGRDAIVKFYDGRYFHSEFGQLVSEYYASTLEEVEDGYGLCLDGGVPSWNISYYNMIEVKELIEMNK